MQGAVSEHRGESTRIIRNKYTKNQKNFLDALRDHSHPCRTQKQLVSIETT